jgi:DNA-binding transcriptional regulator GbsR (MarR family)
MPRAAATPRKKSPGANPSPARSASIEKNTLRPARSSAALDASRAAFVRRWGEMAGYWGINRTMAEIHALLYATTRPLCTDDIMEQLQVSRGNASMNLRSLVDWGLIERTHLRGDRKEYFLCRTDVWQMFETIMLERRRREVAPIIETIRQCRDTVAAELPAMPPHSAEEARAYLARLDAMREFLDTMNSLFDSMLKLGDRRVSQLRTLLTRTIGT